MTELSESKFNELKSYTWPLPEQRDAKTKMPKRRFSWENLIKTPKKSKLFKKRTSNKLNRTNSFNASKSTATKPAFQTSTPLKEIRSSPAATATATASTSNNTSSSSSFTQNTPIAQNNDRHNKPKSTICSDRLGSPKTSLNDFKKLLLNATNKKMMPMQKPSAVEQLKLKQAALNMTPVQILDLSGSPKSFTNRRLFQHVQQSSSSPYKKINVMSPRSRWKYNNFNKSHISSIPEANVEDEIVESKPAESIAKSSSSDSTIYATPQKKPVLNSNKSIERSVKLTPVTPDIEPVVSETESSPETGVIETNFSLRDNFFLQIEENNFMPGEVKPFGVTIRTTLKPSPVNVRKNIAAAAAVDTAPSQPPPSLETSF